MSETKKKIKIGVVGGGWWAALNHIPILLKNPDALVYVADPDPERLKKLKENFPMIQGVYPDLNDLIEEENIEGAVISTPHFMHFEHARLCIEKGLHVSIEKPLTTNAKDARALLSLAEEKKREIFVCYGWNYKPYFEELVVDYIEKGFIGNIEHVSCQMASALKDLFSGEDMIETKEDLFRPIPSTWADPKKSGGYGWGQLTHLLGLLFFLADISPKEVYALVDQSKSGVDFYNSVVGRLENGASFVVSGASSVPKSRTVQVDIRIFGNEGILLLDLERERLELVRHDGKEKVFPLKKGDGEYSCDEPLKRLVQVCQGKKIYNPASGLVGKRATEFLDAMYRSFESGKKETV